MHLESQKTAILTQGTSTNDDEASSSKMEPLAKRISGDWSSVDQEETNMDGLPQHKRSKLLEDHQGDQIISAQTGYSQCQKNESLADTSNDNEHQTRNPVLHTEYQAGSENPTLDTRHVVKSSKTSCMAKNTKGQMTPSHLQKERHSSPDNEEDLYRDEEEIEKDKSKTVSVKTEEFFTGDQKLGVSPEMDIIEYCKKEWRGNTAVAQIMKKGYEEVSLSFGSIRRVRGDNYCALRATLFQALSQTTKLPVWLDDEQLNHLPERLIKKYEWIKSWKFWRRNGCKNVWLQLTEYIDLLKQKWTVISRINGPEEKRAACDDIFRDEEQEYCLYEAVKFLMLKTAIDLFNANEEGKEVPVFSWLLFARNTSCNPCEFMKNHLNQVGHVGGLEQVEMFLLGYALQHTIKVYRLYKCGTDEFITQYPNDPTNWPTVTLITEDDRHYNVPVRVCEETSV
ncbi:hypothetical protein GDO86_011348 [Hymenochirus boettgeri]|nr:hypothetical protein GDO86_011348 [Hymenochirus boettgeri]